MAACINPYPISTGDLLEVATPDEYMYETMWKSVKNRDHMAFQVRACQDAHLIIAQELGEQATRVYEFSIGGWQNNQSVIRQNVSDLSILWVL